MEFHFETLAKNRKSIVYLTENLSEEQLNKIPKGFKNNIAWNVAHLMVTQELLCYKLSGLNGTIKDDVIDKFRKGTKPNQIVTLQEFELIKTHFLDLTKKLEDDYNKGIFKSYNNYTTSLNVELKSFEDALTFNVFHEGIHLGIILQLLKLVS